MLITLALLSAPLGVAPIVTGLTVAVLPTGWFAAFHKLGNGDSLQRRLVGYTWAKSSRLTCIQYCCCLGCKIGYDAVGAGPFETQQAFHHYPFAV